jgi:hypothetical protein
MDVNHDGRCSGAWCGVLYIHTYRLREGALSITSFGHQQPSTIARFYAGIHLLIARHLDMYRHPLPAAHAPRLPAHLLRRLPQGVVPVPSLDRDLNPPIHLPVMPRFGALDAAQCHRYDAPGYVCEGESGPWEVGG